MSDGLRESDYSKTRLPSVLTALLPSRELSQDLPNKLSSSLLFSSSVSLSWLSVLWNPQIFD